MRKEYLILAIIIVALGLYLGFNRSDGTHYRLPQLKELEKGSITRIDIIKPGADTNQPLSLKRQSDTRWTVGPKDYPADRSKVDAILDSVAELTLTALVSESQSYVRYELDDEHKLTVVAYAGDTIARQFDLGKSAPTHRHTFVRLQDNPAVYHAQGDFRYNVEQTVERLRDLQVLTLEPQKVNRVTVKKEDLEMQFEQVSNKPPAAEDPQKEPSAPSAELSWRNAATQQPVSEAKIEALLNELKDLRCSEYIDTTQVNAADYDKALFRVEVKDTKNHSLQVSFKEKIDPQDHLAESLDNAYPFKLSEFKLKEILKTADALLGIEPETPSESGEKTQPAS